jgi:hypothetical protein
MGFKKMDSNLEFADLALASSLEHNRSTNLMEKLNKSIDWIKIDAILMGHYTIGTSGEGADAYPPLMLFKCMLLQKWFRPSTIFRTYGIKIPSDPDLESQIHPVKLQWITTTALSWRPPWQPALVNDTNYLTREIHPVHHYRPKTFSSAKIHFSTSPVVIPG